ncbi:diguanylate cyclase [Metabacillus litoralis]|uniref:sensor domain-containing diguanylate cyclase n=1 Tax=Metabacillus litoralis TaxID=152268 RepID=UPI001CFDEF50|nr:diguanylate cyclase [Metabacillus litoralis]
MIWNNKSKLLHQTNRIAVFMIIMLFVIIIAIKGSSSFEVSRIILGPHYDVFHDSSNKVTVEDLIDGMYDQYFTPSTQKYPFFWHTTDKIWLRLSLDDLIQGNTSGYVIEGIDKQDHVDMYFVQQDGSYTVQKGGIAENDSQSLRYFSNLFTVEEPDVTEVYIALYGELPLMFSSFLYTDNGFLENVITYKFSTGLFYGFLLGLMLYNLFLFFSLKEKAYIFYVLYMFSFIAYQATMNAFDLELVGHALPDWLLFRTLPISCTLLVCFMILFGKEFLELKTHLPKHNRVLKIFLFLTMLSLLSVFTVPNLEAVNNVITLLTVIVLAFLWVSGLTMLLKGFKMARFYMVGWTVLLGSMLIQGFGFLKWIPFHPGLYEIVPATAACFEAIFLSLALGDKINLMKKEMNDKLEEKVQERTKQLEEAKQKLEQLANTDRLTMIANRMRLDAELDKQLQTVKTNGTSLSLIMLDVDHFKAVNDKYGHQVGDNILRETAHLLKEKVRKTDLAGRWGGEEFLVISPNTGTVKALELAEELRQHLENHSFKEVGKTTASFGVATYLEGDTPSSLLSRCDNALYVAKEEGRNQVAFQGAV